MFSTSSSTLSRPELEAERRSPPRKRRKNLDITDVSFLIETTQKAAFLSPEKPATRVLPVHSVHDRKPPAEQPMVKVDVLSQELIEEEDTCIQSSLPHYLDHLFGDCIGGSSQSDHNSRSPAPVSVSCTDKDKNDSPPTIQESQGFTVTNISLELQSSSLVEKAVCPCNAESGIDAGEMTVVSPANVESSPILFQSPILSPPHPASSAHVHPQTSPHSHSSGPQTSPHSHSSGSQTSPHSHSSGRQTSPHSHSSGPQTSPHSHSSGRQTSPHSHSSGPQTSPHSHSSGRQTSPHSHSSGPQTSPHSHSSGRQTSPHSHSSGPQVHQDNKSSIQQAMDSSDDKKVVTQNSSRKSSTTTSTSKLSKKSSRKRKFSSTSKPASKTNYTCPPSCLSLMECTQVKTESIVCILALVLQVNSVMEVACKKGAMAGRTVPVSSLLLGDPTKSCWKLLLWREAACWVERMMAGDLVYFSSIRLKSWRDEVVGHTIMYSKVLNLHQPKKSLPSKLSVTVPVESLHCLLEWGKRRHGYLFGGSLTTPISQRCVYFRSCDELGTDSVIHLRARLVAVISDRVVLLSDKPGKDVFLYLLGALGSVWHRELSEGVGLVWELLYLAVALDGTQDNYSLQVTSRSQLRRLPTDSTDALDILELFSSTSQRGCIPTVQSITTLLQHRASGIVKCKAKATAFNFQLMDGSALTLHSLCELKGLELVSQLLQAVYVGCESCARPLTQDENGVYCPCNECVTKTPGNHLTSAYHYRPLVITLCEESASLEVVANHVVVSKLLDGVTATDLVRASLAQNISQSGAVREAVVRLLASGGSDCWVLNTAFTVDEFSFVESLTVSLLDRTAA